MPTAPFQKFHVFTKNLVDGVHNLSGNVLKVMLTNTAPVVGNTIKANITEIAAGNGYTAGGATITKSVTTTAGVSKVALTDVVITASGAIGPFRYAVIYNDTPTSPADPLIGFIDYGTAITMANLDTFTIDFDAVNGFMTI